MTSRGAVWPGRPAWRVRDMRQWRWMVCAARSSQDTSSSRAHRNPTCLLTRPLSFNCCRSLTTVVMVTVYFGKPQTGCSELTAKNNASSFSNDRLEGRNNRTEKVSKDEEFKIMTGWLGHPMTACSWGPPGAQQSPAVSMVGMPPSRAVAAASSSKFLRVAACLGPACSPSSNTAIQAAHAHPIHLDLLSPMHLKYPSSNCCQHSKPPQVAQGIFMAACADLIPRFTSSIPAQTTEKEGRIRGRSK